MKFLIADTFTDSLANLPADEQKTVKTTAFELQMNPEQPGHQFHKLDRVRDKRFWSVRGSRDLRLIVHRTDDALMLCYAGHHDDAYDWAQRRKLETHPATGAAQFVEIRETVREVAMPRYVELPVTKPKRFAAMSDAQLLGYGVPPDWLDMVRDADDETFLRLYDHLPREAAEALLSFASGEVPAPAQAAAAVPPFEHPDAQRRFRVISNAGELERALEFPWEKWAIFLHPAQRSFVERDYSGPARVSGSAGTGKTIVALHRAVFLARAHPDARVLLATFSDPLANALKTRLRRLAGNEPQLGERLEVHSLDTIGRRLYERNIGPARIVTLDTIAQLLEASAAASPESKFSSAFLIAEWQQIVDAWQVATWETYRDVERLGRKTRLPEKQRAVLWTIFERVRAELQRHDLNTYAEMFSAVAAKMRAQPPFEFAVVDEAQDLTVAQIRFLAALGASRPNALFFAGDLGQRIFQQPFSWKTLGVDVRGRSFTLKINYRTSQQIRSQADRLLGTELSDVDGVTERRDGTISTFNGPPPEIMVCASAEEEIQTVSRWLIERSNEGVAPHEIGVFVRSGAHIERARAAVAGAGLPFDVLDDQVETTSGRTAISTMHLAKGLEFRAVAVMACDDEVIPLQERMENIGDEADLEDAYATERHLLYVACTRARDHLLVTGVEPASEFLDDLGGINLAPAAAPMN